MGQNFKMKINTPEIKRSSEQAIERAMTAVGTFLASEAADALEIAPRRVDSGRLRNSIDSKYIPETHTVAVGTNVEYALYVHEGTGQYATEGGRSTPWSYQDSEGKWHTTHGMKPNRFLKKAFDLNKKQVAAYIENELKKG